MGGDRERMEWNLNRTDTRAAAARRARIHRWSVPGRARVTHPAHGSVVVPHCSNLAAILNAAEVWGVQLGGNPGRTSVGRTGGTGSPHAYII